MSTHDVASSIHSSRGTGLDFDDIVAVLRHRTRNSVSKHWYSKLKKIHGDPDIEAGPCDKTREDMTDIDIYPAVIGRNITVTLSTNHSRVINIGQY